MSGRADQGCASPSGSPLRCPGQTMLRSRRPDGVSGFLTGRRPDPARARRTPYPCPGIEDTLMFGRILLVDSRLEMQPRSPWWLLDGRPDLTPSLSSPNGEEKEE